MWWFSGNFFCLAYRLPWKTTNHVDPISINNQCLSAKRQWQLRSRDKLEYWTRYIHVPHVTFSVILLPLFSEMWRIEVLFLSFTLDSSWMLALWSTSIFSRNRACIRGHELIEHYHWSTFKFLVHAFQKTSYMEHTCIARSIFSFLPYSFTLAKIYNMVKYKRPQEAIWVFKT